VDLIQVRERDLADGELYFLAAEVVRLARGTRCRILVNGRADIAFAAGAHGVHLPASGLSPAAVRRIAPRGFIIGASTHSLREARRAEAGGADYLVLGPLFPTPSKMGYGSPLGLRRFRRIVSRISIPVLGLGGIRPDLIAHVLGAGAAGVAGIRLFQEELELAGREITRSRKPTGRRNPGHSRVPDRGHPPN
jgi:thiamine-phosphate pyrophosphorylase